MIFSLCDHSCEVETTLNTDTLQSLATDQIGAIHVRQFLSKDECEGVAVASRNVASDGAWQAQTSPMQVIGGNFANAVHMDPSEYFATVGGHEAARDRVFAASVDVLARVTDALKRVWHGDVVVAEEPSGRYFAGGIKLRTQPSAPHFDFVPYFTDRYALAAIKEQLSFNVYFTMPEHSGHTDLFAAKVASVPDKLSGFRANVVPPEMLDGVPFTTLRPQVGDLLLFCTRHPHRVVMENVGEHEKRIQMGCFLGLMEDDTLVMWS